MPYFVDSPKKVETWFADNYGAWVPDIVIDPRPHFTYRVARGTRFLIVAFDGIVPMGWVPTVKLGFVDAKAWQEFQG